MPKSTAVPTLEALLRDAMDSVVMGEGAPFSPHFVPGQGKAAVITGPNASGKSLLAQIVAARAHQQGMVPASISIRERTGAGLHEMSGMRRMMMFGDEHEQSTGATSLRALEGGFRSIHNYAKEKPAILILDEPELGLSEDYAAALGTWLAQQAQALEDQPRLPGILVITHSRPLVRALNDALRASGHSPHLMSMEEAHPSVEAWLAARPVRSVEDLAALRELGHARWLEVIRLLDEAKQTKRSKPKAG